MPLTNRIWTPPQVEADPLRAVLATSHAADPVSVGTRGSSSRGCKCDKEFRRFFGETRRTRKLDRGS